jgi:hypothetical protein
MLVPALLPAVAPLVTRGAPPAATAEPKPYTLYMGADLDVQHGKEFLRVQDVVGDSLVATVDGKVRTISTTEGPVSLRVQHSLKLDRTTVTISDLKSERAYSPANDPWRKWANRGTMADTGAAERQFLDAQAARDLNAARASNPGLGRAQEVFAAQQPAMQAAYDSAANNFNQAGVDAGGDLYNPGLMAQQTQDELAKKLFDAMEVDFTVSAPEPLADPYVVLLAQYHVPAEPKGTAHNWIYAKALDSINDRPRRIHVLKGGFPPGFELEKLAVHLYSRGREIATNVAEKRLELTRDEAFQYTVIDYLARHKDVTLPPVLAMGRLAADARQHLSAGQLHQTYFVKVTKDGLPEDAFLDPSCLHRVDDPSLRAVIRELRFTPALLKGQPVAAVASLNLDDLPP